jgi:hypothetical protein
MNLLLSIMSSIWTCNFCYISMPVAEGPYHLIEDDHMKHLTTRLSNITTCLVNNRKSKPFTPYSLIEEEYALVYSEKPAPASKPNSPTEEEYALSYYEKLAPASKPNSPTEEEYALSYSEKPIPTSKPNRPTLARSESPIDQFFESFPSFKYNPSLLPSTSYKHLQKYQKWLPGSPESKENWERYQSALRHEFDLWYGAEDDLNAWHSLCRAIGINPLPATCMECEKVCAYLRTSGANLQMLI